MPKITNPKVIKILQHPYFDQHTAMHLARERLTLPDGKTKLPLILPPCLCGNCRDDGAQNDGGASMPAMASGAKPAGMGGTTMPAMASGAKPAAMGGTTMPAMASGAEPAGTPDTTMPGMSGGDMSGGMPDMKEAGEEGSGRQLLEMHHEMIRVFRFLLCQANLRFLAEWPADPNQPDRNWTRPANPDDTCYAPELWDLDDPSKLPHEITGMLKVTDPDYLDKAFAGVKERVESSDGKVDDAVDKLGIYIEQGVKSGPPDGSGFHETMHEYLASREGLAAQGAEMNRLNFSRFNDYFWSLHLWIDAQYGRLLERRRQRFDTSELDPATVMDKMCTGDAAPAKAAAARTP